MTIKLFVWGLSSLAGTLLWNIMQGADAERTSAVFGGGFSMLVTLAIMTWAFSK